MRRESRVRTWFVRRAMSFVGIALGGVAGWLYWRFATDGMGYPLWFNVLTGAVVGGVVLGSFRISLVRKNNNKSD